MFDHERFATPRTFSALILIAACSQPAPKPAVTPTPSLRANTVAESAQPAKTAAASAPAAKPRRVIIFVWDGLRPDSIDATLTPELARLRDQRGVDFSNHHAIFPSFTMINAAAFATGAGSAVHGFYGNYEYQPGPSGQNAKGVAVDYGQPFFSEDHAILQALDAFYQKSGSALLRVETLFQVAHAAHVTTAAIGKSGPVFLQDYRQNGESGVILDENVVLPRSFGLALQAAGIPLPKNTVRQRYPDGELTLAADNGDPSAVSEPALITLADGVTSDPRAQVVSPHNARNEYLMRVFLEYVLPKLDPALSMLWLRNPDSTQHNYGPGTPPVRDALRHQDQLLGKLLATLARLGRLDATDLLIVSDHGHSTVASDAERLPARGLSGEADGRAVVGAIETPGYSASGDVRSVDWLRHAGFPHVYDGVDCVLDPVLGGVDAHGKPVYPPHEDFVCKKKLPRASTPNYELPADRHFPDTIVIAANGGSEYFYVEQHDPRLVRRLVSALQERKPYGALFVRALYGEIPGTLPFSRIGLEASDSVSPPMPDVVVSFDWDDAARTAAGASTGSEHASPQGYRGNHGSFSPVDIHNTLIAVGPDFRPGFRDEYPSSSLDVAPTVAALLGLPLPHAEGRVLDEALTRDDVHYDVERFVDEVGPVPLRKVCEVDDPACKRPHRGGSYGFRLQGQVLSDSKRARRFVYFDQAKVSRTPAPVRGPQR